MRKSFERRNQPEEYFYWKHTIEEVIGKRRMFIKSPSCAAVQVPDPVLSVPLPVFSIMKSYVIFEYSLVQELLMMI